MTFPIAVIDAWRSEKIASVRLLFELISYLQGNLNELHHAPCLRKEEIADRIVRLGNDSRFSYLYIACRGDAHLSELNGEQISGDEFRSLLEQTTTCQGIHFATGMPGLLSLASSILGMPGPVLELEYPRCSIRWLSGYRFTIDQSDSMVCDLLLSNLLVSSQYSNCPEPERIYLVAEQLQNDIGPLCRRLGFSIFVGGIEPVDLMSPRPWVRQVGGEDLCP